MGKPGSAPGRMSEIATYRLGTYRLVPPEMTLRRVKPLLHGCGITRCTSVTHLDALGIQTFCSIRPGALTLQVSNGKGVTRAAAEVSAIMEALELFHAENPPRDRFQRTCIEALYKRGETFLHPAEINGYHGNYFSDQFICDWIQGQNLVIDAPLWVPASAIYFHCTPSLHHTESNGLASGNSLTEATHHALFELIERDAVSSLFENKKFRISERAVVIDLDSVTAPEVKTLARLAINGGIKPILIWVQSVIPLHTFWAIFLAPHSTVAMSTINMGHGTHVDPAVAAARALTEAAQTRLSIIHGSRDDLVTRPVYRAEDVQSTPAYRFFDRLETTGAWDAMVRRGAMPILDDLESGLLELITALAGAGHRRIIRVDLTDPAIGMPVVKLFVPGLRFNEKIF